VNNVGGLAVVLAVSSMSFSVQAGWLDDAWSETKSMASSLWDDTKEASGEVWQDTKNASSEAWEDTKEVSAGAWKETKKASSEVVDSMTSSQSDENSLSDIKKLGDKETYVKAWEGIKESARNPGAPNVDENGVPKE